MRLSLPLTPSLLWISDTSFTLSSHSCLCLIGNCWISCYLISKQSTLSTSTGISAWLTLNRRGWPDTDHQFSEERAVVRESCIFPRQGPRRHRAAIAHHSPAVSSGEAEDDKHGPSSHWEDIIMQKSRIRCWQADKNLLLIYKDFRMGKTQGDKIPQLSMQGSGKSPSPAPPAKLSVPVFSAGTTSASTARCSQQQSNSCTIQAATEWLNSSLYRHGVIKTWCSFVLYKAPTLLTPSSNLTGY